MWSMKALGASLGKGEGSRAGTDVKVQYLHHGRKSTLCL